MQKPQTLIVVKCMMILDITNNFMDAKDLWQSGEGQYWLLINQQELNLIKDKIFLDPEVLDECKNNYKIPKISFFKDYLFLIASMLTYKEEKVSIEELDVILSKNYIITVIKENTSIIYEFLRDIVESKNCHILMDKPKAYMVLYYILDRIIVKNYSVISVMEASADRIEINILKNPENRQIDKLINIRRQVFKIKKCLNPLMYIGDSLLGNDNSIIEKENMSYFINLNNKINKLMISLENLVQDLALVREAFESEIANKTNELMKVFTIIATIFLPLDLITGLLSMNVKHVPLVELEFGYYYILAFMATIAGLLCIVFKTKKWL